MKDQNKTKAKLISELDEMRQRVSELEQSETEWVQEDEKFRIIFESAPDAYYLCDLRGKFIDGNKAAERTMGYRKEELLGKSYLKLGLLPKNQIPKAAALLAQNVLNKPTGPDQFTLIRKDGNKIEVEITTRPVKIKGKRLVLGIARDITERVQTEQALQESEEKYRTLFEKSGDANLIIQNEVFVDCNQATVDMLGYATKEKLLETHPSELSPEFQPDGKPSLEKANEMMQIALENRSHRFEWDHQRANGEVFPVEVLLTDISIEEDNRVIHTVWRDLTERVRAEEEKRMLEAHLRQHQKLESVGTLAGGVAHEINNPLTGIMNYAQLIYDRIDPAEERLREFSAGIIEETERVAEIVRNLLTFSRQDQQSHSPARMADIVNGTLTLIRTIIKRDQITLVVDVPDDLPTIKCRSQQIQQVLMNLLTNARDALNERYHEYDPDKIISVKVNLFEKDDRRWLRTTVEDHGLGIPTEIRERIFDPFFTTKDRATGTGLGLSISIGIVRDHHGELTFESVEYQPTRFYLDLPVDNGWAL